MFYNISRTVLFSLIKDFSFLRFTNEGWVLRENLSFKMSRFSERRSKKNYTVS